MRDSDGALGIFDSGVGGLTVMRRISERLPSEPIIYLGDTARVPYGTKSADTVIRYAQACARVLLDRHIKLLVIACNTASAYALDALRAEVDIPVLGVIEPGAEQAVDATASGRVGVIGTAGTIMSGAYQKAIKALAPEAEVFCRACPLFVPLAEEGWTEGPVPIAVARTYLEDLASHTVDTVVLGCTHYPLLKGVVAQVMGDGVTLVDSAEATSVAVAETLERKGLARTPHALPPRNRFLATDDTDSFARLGRQFLGHDIDPVEWVDLS
jgi:glutamate racemase